MKHDHIKSLPVVANYNNEENLNQSSHDKFSRTQFNHKLTDELNKLIDEKDNQDERKEMEKLGSLAQSSDSDSSSFYTSSSDGDLKKDSERVGGNQPAGILKPVAQKSFKKQRTYKFADEEDEDSKE